MEGDELHGLQLVENDFDNSFFGRDFRVQPPEYTSVENQFLQQQGDVHYKTSIGKRAAKSWQKVESSHQHAPVYSYRMRGFCRNPDGAQCWDNPHAFPGGHVHHALRGKEQLVLRMRMRGNEMAVREVRGYACDFREAAAVFSEQYTLTSMRHLLSQ